MSTPSCSSLRRIGALVIIPMIMLLGACGTKYDLTIHGDTVDQTILMWDSKDQMTEDNCSKEGMASAGVNPADDVPEGVDVKYTFTDHDGHPACEIKATNVPLSQFDGKGARRVRATPRDRSRSPTRTGTTTSPCRWARWTPRSGSR